MKNQKDVKKALIGVGGMMTYFVIKKIAEKEKEKGCDNTAEFLNLLNERLNCGVPDKIFKITEAAIKLNRKMIEYGFECGRK